MDTDESHTRHLNLTTPHRKDRTVKYRHSIITGWDTSDADLGMAAGPSTEVKFGDGRRVAADAIWTKTDGIRWFTHWSTDQPQPALEVDGITHNDIVRYLEDEITALQTIRDDIVKMRAEVARVPHESKTHDELISAFQGKSGPFTWPAPLATSEQDC